MKSPQSPMPRTLIIPPGQLLQFLGTQAVEPVGGNARLIKEIALEYANKGISFNELLDVGKSGFMQAISAYDSSKGFRFSSFAPLHIRRAIEKSFSKKIINPENNFEFKKGGIRTKKS